MDNGEHFDLWVLTGEIIVAWIIFWGGLICIALVGD